MTKLKPATPGVCRCGCLRAFSGNVGRQYYSQSCRVKVMRIKRKGERQ